jgi:predicted MFS family arabinose efflux permease/pimeloyl-ACP methyl ester carboxylesterase
MSASVASTTAPADASRLAAPAASLLILVALIDSQVVGAVTPQIAEGLGAAPATVAGSVTYYSLAAASVALGLGWVPRPVRPRAWLPLAALLFAAASVACAAAPHVSVFLGARALAGFAGGLISALAIAALADASSYDRRGRQMSWVAIAYFLAPVAGVPMGAFLTGRYGWRTVFVLSAVAVAAAGLLVRIFPLPGAPAADGAGARPSLWRLAMRSRSTRMGIASAFFISGGLVGFTTFLGTWLFEAFYAGPREVGLVYALAGITAVAGGALGGMLADKLGKRPVAAYGSAVMGALLLLLPTFAWGVALFALVGATAFVAAIRVAPLQALITELVEPAERATYVALRNGASQLGIATAVAAGGAAYAGYGLVGVAAMCALMSAVAWLTINRIEDPQVPARARTARGWRRRFARHAAAAAVTLAVIVLFVAPLLLSLLITKAKTRPGERDLKTTPAALGAAYRDVTFTSSDGNQLSGWYLPSREAGITIVMTHGLFRSRYELFERGVELWKRGYGVVLYDLRRHGGSPAEFSTLGYDERHDVLAALELARQLAPDDRYVLMGVSMGAAATLLAATEADGLLAVIAESSFLSFEDTVYHHLRLARIPVFPFAPLLVHVTSLRMDFDPDDFDVLAAVRRIDRPILFIGSGDDDRMPTETVLEPLYAAAPHPLKRKFVVDGARHGHAYEVAPEAYVEVVNTFLQEVSASSS